MPRAGNVVAYKIAVDVFALLVGNEKLGHTERNIHINRVCLHVLKCWIFSVCALVGDAFDFNCFHGVVFFARYWRAVCRRRVAPAERESVSMLGKISGVLAAKFFVVMTIFMGATSVPVCHTFIIQIHKSAAEFAAISFLRGPVVVGFHIFVVLFLLNVFKRFSL